MRKTYELELYKLLINPEEDDIDILYVDEFGWVSNTEFYIWISLNWFNEFAKRLSDILAIRFLMKVELKQEFAVIVYVST